MKIFILSILVSLALIGGALVFVGGRSSGPDWAVEGNNVSMSDGRQVIRVSAKGGYWPQNTVAQAGVPTLIKVDTQGTFDCSSALVIPSLNYSINLPPAGETVIDVPPQKAGSVLQGLCAMGMYGFQIQFN